MLKSTCFLTLDVLDLIPTANRVLDKLPNLLGPVIQIVGEVVGMHISVLIGGPEPKKKGQLNMLAYTFFVCMIPRC